MKLILRQYQEQSVYLLDRAINAKQHPLCVIPTGGGKSLVIAALLKKRGEPALVLSHNATLLKQNARILRRMAPEIDQSFFVASLKEKDARAQVVFGSVQSVYRSLEKFKRKRPLLFIDEAHLCPPKADAMYGQVFEYFVESQRVGFTATPMRFGSGPLVQVDGKGWFDSIGHEVKIAELIAQGFLTPLAGVITEQQALLDGVAKRGGEFVAEAAEAAVMRTLALPEAVRQACDIARARKSWLVFASGVTHAEQIVQELRAQGVSSEVIIADTDDDARQDIIDRFAAGDIRALVNVGVLTTGFDAPNVDCIVSFRPTMSPVLWQQILGRGMRLFAGKKNCLLLDFVGNLERLGGADSVVSIDDRRAVVQMPKKEPTRNKRRFTRPDPELFDASALDPMLSGQSFDAVVDKVSFYVANSKRYPGKRLVIVNYELEDSFGRAVEAKAWLCVEYPGGARFRAAQWFARRGVFGGDVPADSATAAALARVLEDPAEVTARYDPRLRCCVVDAERFALSA